MLTFLSNIEMIADFYKSLTSELPGFTKQALKFPFADFQP